MNKEKVDKLYSWLKNYTNMQVHYDLRTASTYIEVETVNGFATLQITREALDDMPLDILIKEIQQGIKIVGYSCHGYQFKRRERIKI